MTPRDAGTARHLLGEKENETPRNAGAGGVFVLYGLRPPQKGLAGDAMSTQDDFYSQPDLDDDASDGRALQNPFDNPREKLLRDWVDRFAEIIDYYDMPELQRWKATHIREEVAVPNRYTGETQICEVYIKPIRGCTFTTTNKIFARFAQYSDFLLRQLQRAEKAHRGWNSRRNSGRQ